MLYMISTPYIVMFHINIKLSILIIRSHLVTHHHMLFILIIHLMPHGGALGVHLMPHDFCHG
jgi:hypothetical protein